MSTLIALFATGAIATTSVAIAQMLSAATLLIALGALSETPRSAVVIVTGVVLGTVVGQTAERVAKSDAG